jgi:elongation factor Ts
MAVSLEAVKKLRELTLASVADCKKALDEAKGDLNQANEWLKKRGLEIAAKKATRAANQGRIEAYVHTGNKIGVLLEVNCETDFVARNEDFARLCKDVAMQVAASDPKFVRPEDAPADELKDLDDKAKNDYLKSACLLRQPFIKDPSQTIQDHVTAAVAKIGENIIIRRFMRYKIGE